MKEYRIVVNSALTRKEIIKMLKFQNYSEEKIKEVCRGVFKISGVHIITTLEEYFTLISEITWLTCGDFSVWNYGTNITLFTDPEFEYSE